MANIITPSGGRGFPNGIKSGIDWAKADYASEAGRKDLAKAITDYFEDIREGGKQAAIAGAKTTRGGHIGLLPAVPDVDVGFYSIQEDAGVLSLFRNVDMTGSRNDTYQLAHVSAGGIVFEQQVPGQPIRIRKVSDSAATSLKSVTWGGALGIDDDTKRFDRYNVFEENVQAVPVKYVDKMVDVHVALLTALGVGVNETWDTDLVTTINSAAAQILEDVGDTYGLPDNPEFVLYYNHRRAPLVRQALVSSLTLANDNNSAKQLEFSIRPVKTRKITTASMYLALPGYDMVSVEWDPLFSEYGRDFERGSDAFVWRARRNAAIGNTGQIRRITPA